MNSNSKRKYLEIIDFPSVSVYHSRKEWEEACWQKLLRSPARLNHLATPYERRVFVMRAAVAHRLQIGMSYRAIGQELWLSPQTISTIKKGIGETRYRSYVERGKTERKKKVYSTNRSTRPKIRIGRPRKTKYGTVYL